MNKKKEEDYFYAVINIDALSKEDLWDYRPEKVLLVLSEYDVSQIKRYMEFTMAPDNENSDGVKITVKYPVEVEKVKFQDPTQSFFDENCIYDPAGESIYIVGDHLYFKMTNACDDWDDAEGEFLLDLLKPMKDFQEDLELKNVLEN